MNTVIAAVDAIKPNPYADEEKARWLSRLDGIISLEVMQEKEAVSYEYPKDMDTPLLLPESYDEAYIYYIFAMIDFANREYSNYNNSMAMFNERFNDYKKHYMRNNMPFNAGGYKNITG